MSAAVGARIVLPVARKGLPLVVAGGLLPLLLGEGILRVAGLPLPMISGWRAREYIAEAEKNELGFRGHPIRYADGDQVIVLLGDSQVEANTGTSFDHMPGCRLQQCLNEVHHKSTKVVTVGTAGWGTDQELLALRDYFRRFRADLVALWFTPRNDVLNNTFPTIGEEHGATPKPTFWLEGGELRGPTEGLCEPVARPGLRLLALAQRLLAPSRDQAWETRLPAAYVPLQDWTGPVGDLEVLWNTTQRELAFENLDTEKGHLSMYLTPPSPRLRYGVDLTRRLIQEIEREARARNGRLVVFTTSIENSLRASEPVVVRWRGKHYRVSSQQFDANERAVMDGFDSHVVPVTVQDWAVGTQDKHLNQRAIDEVMPRLAAILAVRVPGH